MAEEQNITNRQRRALREVKYSLREMLLEVDEDRENSAIGREMVEQTEIEKLFKRKVKGKRVKRRE